MTASSDHYHNIRKTSLRTMLFFGIRASQRRRLRMHSGGIRVLMGIKMDDAIICMHPPLVVRRSRVKVVGRPSRLNPPRLRAHPGSLDSWRGICAKSPEHDADHGEADECSNSRCVAFEVASQAAVTTGPREHSFDDPHLGSTSTAASDRLTICKLRASAPHRHCHLASRVSAVSKNV
jgi:hypothetical protein